MTAFANLRYGNIFDSVEEVIVIPCSTTGTISGTFREGVYKAGISISSPDNQLNLGDIFFITQTGSKISNLKYVALACTVDTNLQGSTYKAIRDIGYNLARKLPEVVNSIAILSL